MSKHDFSFAPAAREISARDPDHHNGWTPDKQAAFLRELSAGHNVAAAARAVGLSRQSAYKLRARLKGEPFDLAWDAAFQNCFDALAEAAMERAMNGVEVPHFHKGELVGTSRRFDERLTVALLAMRSVPRRPRQPDWHPASAYPPEEFERLVKRVERGPETWDEERRQDYEAYAAEDFAEDLAGEELAGEEERGEEVAPPQLGRQA